MLTVTQGCVTDVTQRPFTTFDGHTLALFDWPLASDPPSNGAPPTRPKAVVLVVHGLGEHAWRYHQLATELNAAGCAVRAYDQRGHGESSGPRGCLPGDHTLLQDLAEVVDDTRATLCRTHHIPLVLFGHGLGGLVSALWVGRTQQTLPHHQWPVDALVLSSPALRVDWGLWQRRVLAALPSGLPHITVSSGLDARELSHAPEVVSAYQEDPLVHDRVSHRLLRFMTEGGLDVLDMACQWRVPTLLMYSGSDLVVNPLGSQRFAQRSPVGVVESHCFEDFFHDVLHETHRLDALNTLVDWFRVRF
jgi:alpha-beta hydrolase superfamily lysophospholipase